MSPQTYLDDLPIAIARALRRMLEVDRQAIPHGQSVNVSPGASNFPVLEWRAPGDPTQPWNLSVTAFAQLLTGVTVGMGANAVFAALPPSQQSPEMTLNLEWGVGGTQSQATLDLDHDVTFALAASWLRVNVNYLGVGTILLSTLPQARVGVHISEASRGDLPKPRLTTRLGAANDGVSVTVAVPAYAWRVRPLVAYPVGGLGVFVDQLDAMGTQLTHSEYGSTEPNESELLHDAAKLVRVTNNTGVVLSQMALVWELGL